MKKALRWLLICLCAGLLVYACGQLVGTLMGYRAGEAAYEALTEDIVLLPSAQPTAAPAPSDEPVQEEEPRAAAPIEVDFAALMAQYPDTVAWLYCPNTPVNYPVMQAQDNEKYLHALPDGTSNAAGTLFLDYRCAADFSDGNSFIYGHNMKNGSMFAVLTDYEEQDFYEAHPVWYLLTPEKTYTVELIAGYVTPAVSDAYMIPGTEQERDEMVRKALERSDFSTKAAIGKGERLLTLSTCSYEYEDARYVLVGVLREMTGAPEE